MSHSAYAALSHLLMLHAAMSDSSYAAPSDSAYAALSHTAYAALSHCTESHCLCCTESPAYAALSHCTESHCLCCSERHHSLHVRWRHGPADQSSKGQCMDVKTNLPFPYFSPPCSLCVHTINHALCFCVHIINPGFVFCDHTINTSVFTS